MALKILFLAPHPFYQNRGTPIAVNLVLKVLSQRGDHVDIITYPEGQNKLYPNVTIHRTPQLPLIDNIRPGFSWKKIVCDVFMFFQALRLVLSNKYDLVHAGEEAVFIGLVLKFLFNIPYVYDMDSSLSQQMIEKYPRLTLFTKFFNFFEKVAVKHAKAVIPVCEALAYDIKKYRPHKIVVIPDISLLS